MTALKFGVPHVKKIYCANPVCQDYAEMHVTCPDGDVFACKAHITALTQHRRITRIETLKVAGERNPEPKSVP